jgi:DNA-binding MarR family transcriptional regulator
MDRVLFTIRRTGVSYAARTAKLLEKWHFTHARIDIFVIHDQLAAWHGIVHQSTIRGRLGVSRRTMSVMMQRLERRGMIERHRSTSDRRQLVVTITELGRSAYLEARARIGEKLFTPLVDDCLFLRDWVTAIPKQRATLLGTLDLLRYQFGCTVTPPYGP